MKLKKPLYRQLASIVIILVGIVIISLGLLIPKLLRPVYEKTIYQYLRTPLELVKKDIDDVYFENIAYMYIVDKEIIVSENFKDVISMDTKQILNNITDTQGKFKYLGKTYYYYNIKTQYINKIAITNNSYIISMKSDIMTSLIPTIALTLIISLGIVILWARSLVVKIEHLKEKVDNLDNDNYVDDYEFKEDDELYKLSLAIDNMKLTLKKQEEYKNQMYQNISHDFKTPITVIKSYIEAIEDGVITPSSGSEVIKEQIEKLENKVHSLLYLNKLAYLSTIENHNERIDVKPIIESSVAKFKMSRQDISFTVNSSSKTMFNGTPDHWEAIIDNLLSNFMRYAIKEIKITIKNNKIILYNDGPNIDTNILDDMFTPYKKGIKGEFGLGLSIVKKTLALLEYEITVVNEKKGVSFIIK